MKSGKGLWTVYLRVGKYCKIQIKSKKYHLLPFVFNKIIENTAVLQKEEQNLDIIY